MLQLLNDHSPMAHSARETPGRAGEGGRTPLTPARAERLRRRRAEILDAAAHLMQESGYHAVSMQAVAERAEISVGLIYQYFGNKEDLLGAVIGDILEDFHDRIPAAMERAGGDPVERLGCGFRTFCEVIAAKPEATLLAYRESGTLSPAARDQMKDLEVRTSLPLRRAVADGIASGAFSADVDPDLVVHNLVLLAHGWALKHWNLAPKFTLEQYVEQQFALLLRAIGAPAD